MRLIRSAPLRNGLIAGAAAVCVALSGLTPLGQSAPAEAATAVPNVAKLAGKLSKQKLKWEECPPDRDLGVIYTETTKCALVTVPRDWKDSKNGKTWKFRISYNKLNDPKNSRFKGIIVGNPGGPGNSGLGMAELLATSMPDASPYYNYVGFTPRGIDAESQATCDYTVDPADKSPFAEAKAIGKACAGNADVKTISTEQTAYDMDFIRHILGQEKLNYFGYSYGTWLGTWYSQLFHSKAGLMTLDSALDTTQASYQHDKEFEPWAFQRQDDLWFAPQDKRKNSKEGVTADSFNPDQAPPATTASEKEQEQFLKEQKNSSSSTVRKTADDQLKNLEKLKNLNSQESAESDTKQLANMSYMVRCNDGQYTQGEKYWEKWVNRAQKEVPDNPYGAPDYYSAPAVECLNWRTQTSMPVADPETYPKTIVLQSELDSKTAWEHGRATGLGLPNTRFIAVDNEAAHGVFPYATEEVDRKVIDFYLKGKLPKKDITVAQGKPVPGEDVSYEYWKPLNSKAKHVGELVTDPWQKAGTPTTVPVPIEGEEIVRQGELTSSFRSWVATNYGAEGLKLIS